MSVMATSTDRQQQMRSLRKANRVRLDAATVRREVRDGKLWTVDALWDERAGSLEVLTLLLEQRGWGPTKAKNAMNAAQVRHDRRVRELTERQRRMLAAAIGGPPRG